MATPAELSEILDLAADDEVDLRGLSAEVSAQHLDINTPAHLDQIFAIADSYTHYRRRD